MTTLFNLPRPVLRRFLLCLLPALVVGVGLTGYLALQPEVYRARVVMVPHPLRGTPAEDRADYPAIVTANLPAAIELAKSPNVLAMAARDVQEPYDPSLPSRTSAEIVSTSSMVRISVDDSDPGRAERLAGAVARRVANADFLTGVAKLQPVDPGPQRARLVQPDRRLAVALGLLGVVVTALAGLALSGVLTPTIWSRQQIGRALGDSDVPVFDVSDPGEARRAMDLISSVGGGAPTAIGPAADEVLAQLARIHPDSPLVVDPEGRWVLVAAYGRSKLADLESAVALAERSRQGALAVLVGWPPTALPRRAPRSRPDPDPDLGSRRDRSRRKALG